jgi:hypothetical protein
LCRAIAKSVMGQYPNQLPMGVDSHQSRDNARDLVVYQFEI